MGKSYILFRIKGTLMGTYQDNINEVVGVETLVNTDEEGLKAIVYDGEVTPVIDPQVQLTINPDPHSDESRILIAEKDGATYGFLVKSLEGMENILEDELEEPSITDKNYVRRKHKDLEIIDLRDFVSPEIESLCESLRKAELTVVTEAEKSVDYIKKEDHIKKEIEKDLINLILDKKNELSQEQVSKISDIHKKIEGM